MTPDGQISIEPIGVENLTPYTEPDLEQVRKEAYDTAYADAEEIYESGKRAMYQKGLKDAWEAARRIIHMPEGDLLNIFTECYSAVCTALQVILKYDASEAIEKIRQYEQEKDRQARIEFNGEEIKDVLNTTVKECNVSLDEIAAVLEKMRGETNE